MEKIANTCSRHHKQASWTFRKVIDYSLKSHSSQSWGVQDTGHIIHHGQSQGGSYSHKGWPGLKFPPAGAREQHSRTETQKRDFNLAVHPPMPSSWLIHIWTNLCWLIWSLKTNMGNAWRTQAASRLDCCPPVHTVHRVYKALESRLGAEAKQEVKLPGPACEEELWEAAIGS